MWSGGPGRGHKSRVIRSIGVGVAGLLAVGTLWAGTETAAGQRMRAAVTGEPVSRPTATESAAGELREVTTSPRAATEDVVPSSPAAESAAESASPDPADPSTDPLAQQAAARDKALADLAVKVRQQNRQLRNARAKVTITMSTFNIQGASHRGNVRGRMSGTVRLLNSHGVDVVALQEFTRGQVGMFQSMAGGTYQVYPGMAGRPADGENAVAWRRADFTMLKAETRPYPYFHGSIRNMPRVLLRHNETGAAFWVTSYHNPADCCGFGPQGRFRAEAVRRQIADANALRAATQQPLIIAGDMNEFSGYFCKMAVPTRMKSADGGTTAGGCRLPPRPWIDWILGTEDIEFSNYVRDRSGLVRASSDHPIVVVQATITGARGSARQGEASR